MRIPCQTSKLHPYRLEIRNSPIFIPPEESFTIKISGIQIPDNSTMSLTNKLKGFLGITG